MKKLIIATCALTLLAGCTTFKKVTGSQNDTVLPGQRQDILPPDQQVARDPTVAGQSAVPPTTAVAQNGVQTTPITPPPSAGRLAMPKAATADCDPKVDLCPEPVAPDPLPPPSPVKVEKTVKTADVAKPGVATSVTKMAKKKVIKKKKKTAKAAAPAAVAPDVPPPVPAPPQPQGQ